MILASNGRALIEGYKLLNIPKEKIRIGRVITAAKVARDTTFLARHNQEYINSGYSLEDIDIEGKTESEILDFFSHRHRVVDCFFILCFESSI